MWNLFLTAGIIVLTLGAIGHFVDKRERPGEDTRSAALQLLPGDIKYESPSGNFRFYFPVTTSIILSIVLSMIMRLLS